jgi:uncharacterized protein
MQKLPYVLVLLITSILFWGFTSPPNKGGGGDKKDKSAKKKNRRGQKISSLGVYEGYRKAEHKGFDYSATYIPMPDSVQLALDIFVPKKSAIDSRKPTLVYFVRYCRTLDLKPFFRFAGSPFFGHVPKKEIDFFTSHGYNCVIVDLRGSGASFGFRTMEFSPQEVKDMSTVMDWVIAQSWSDGKIATTGVSYTGTTAEFALTTRHPALKACIPRSAIFDLYSDMNFPGGIRQTPFIEIWKKTTQALDRNDLSVFGGKAKIAVRGIMPVNRQYELLHKAVAEHKNNFDIFAGLYRVESRDDKDPATGLSVDTFSVHNYITDIEANKVPIYRISGWYDGANINSAIKGFWNVANTERLLIGAWDHGPEQHISPFDYQKKTKFDVYTEMLRFLDFHLLNIDNGINKEPKVAYFQMGKEEFATAQTFPPANVAQQTFFLHADQSLASAKPTSAEASSLYQQKLPLVGMGGGSRWNCLTPLYRYSKKISYPNLDQLNKRMLCFTTAPQTTDVEITGFPQIDLYIASDTTDALIFAYLEDVAPDGKVTYITDGQLRAIYAKESDPKANSYKVNASALFQSFTHEDMTELEPGMPTLIRFELIPTSYLLRKGHSIRIAITTSDSDHFDTPAALSLHPIEIFHDSRYPSALHIPVQKSTN